MSTEDSTDPIEQLTHDHGQLSALVQSAAEALGQMERGEELTDGAIDDLAHAIEQLRDALLNHFAREEEGLFPFVEAHVPSLAAEVSRLLADHDAVIARATELGRAVSQAEGKRVGFALCVSTYDRFVEVYASHAQTEQALLRAVDAALGGDDRKALRSLLEQI